MDCLLDTIVQIEFDPTLTHTFFLRSHAHTVFVDLARTIPQVTIPLVAPLLPHNLPCFGTLQAPKTIDYPININPKYRRPASKKKANAIEDSNFCMINKYKGLIGFKCLGSGKLVFVENPWNHILDQLPDMLARKRYGT